MEKVQKILRPFPAREFGKSAATYFLVNRQPERSGKTSKKGMVIKMEFIHEENRIAVYSAENTVIAEVTFPAAADGTVDVNHTFVDSSLRGKGVAGTLMEELVAELRRTGKKAKLSCSYAIGWFEKHPECGDVLNG